MPYGSVYEIEWIMLDDIEDYLKVPKWAGHKLDKTAFVWGDFMGTYLNPGNKGFQEILQSGYVDKTGLIALINQTVGTMQKLTCISRPRRFGKSYAAKMLCAYYDCSCDSHVLFDDKEIARTQGYLTHLNQYHVINLDITGFISDATGMYIPLSNVPNMIADAIQTSEKHQKKRSCSYSVLRSSKNGICRKRGSVFPASRIHSVTCSACSNRGMRSWTGSMDSFAAVVRITKCSPSP